MSNKNLWGDLSDLKTIRTPRTILEEQARYLTEATEGVLVGEVEAQEAHEFFSYDLDVVVPTLNNYRYTLLTIRHPVRLYPVELFSNASGGVKQCQFEGEFEAVLGKILSSEETKTILSRLLSQTR